MSGTLTTSIIEDEAGAGAPIKDAAGGAMQNKYVGDIGDFGKYGLLRHLTGMTDRATLATRCAWAWSGISTRTRKITVTGVALAICSDKRNNHKKYRECDTELYDELHKIVIKEKDRRVIRVRRERDSPRQHSLLRAEPLIPYR